MDCSPWGREESDTTELLHFHFSLSCVGEENGNPLQCSCLENPRDKGAWWASVCGVAQSLTQQQRAMSQQQQQQQRANLALSIGPQYTYDCNLVYGMIQINAEVFCH